MGSSSRQQIGEKFFMGMHHIIFQRPEDGTVRLKKIFMGKKELWSGDIATNTRISINKPELFGGERKEGGVVGDIDIEFGETSQLPNDYLQAAIGAAVPAFRHLVGTVWRQPLVTSMTPYVKKVEYVYEVIHGQSWYSATADIDGECNPAHMVRDAVINLMGKPESALDDTLMRAAADVYYDEGLGLSMTFSGGSVTKFIEDIERHTHSTVAEDPRTGLIFMKPLRDDYDASQALHLTRSTNIKKFISIERKTTSELTNELVVKYTPKGTDKTVPLVFHNLASILQQNATISQTINYPAIGTADNAVAAASRDMPLVSTPLAKVELSCNRQAAFLKPGDVVRLTWPEEDFNETVFRILNVNYGSLRKREIRLVLTEDVFAAPTSTYLNGQTSLFTDPIQPAANFANQRALELTYWDVRFTQQDDTEYDDSVAFAGGMVGQENRYVSAMDMYFNLGGYVRQASDSPAATATLAQSIDRTQVTIPIENTTQGALFYTIGYYILVNNEYMRIDAISSTQLTVGRGCLDTIPQEHTLGDLVWFAEEFIAMSNTELVDNQSVQVKFVMNSGSDYYDINLASVNTVTMEARYGKPYPPANVTIDGSYFPATATDNVSFAWSHRDRTQQLARPIPDWFDGNIGPESYILGSGTSSEGQNTVNLTFNVAYNLRLYDTAISTVTPIVEEKGIVKNSFIYPDDSIFFSNATGTDTLDPYPSCRIFQNAVSCGIHAPSSETYYNPALVFNDAYNSSVQISGPSATFDPLKNAQLDAGMFSYSPTSGISQSSSFGSNSIKVNLLNAGLSISFVGYNSSSSLHGARCQFNINFLDQNDQIVFNARLNKKNAGGGLKDNWQLQISIKNSSEFVYTREISFSTGFSISLSGINAHTLSVGNSGNFVEGTSISAICPVANVRKMQVVSSNVEMNQENNAINGSSFLYISHSLQSGLLYPLTLSGRTIRAELETVKLDNTSLQTYEHTFTVS